MGNGPGIGHNGVPTRVGVNRMTSTVVALRLGCPHARGGEPDVMKAAAALAQLSPRAWG